MFRNALQVPAKARYIQNHKRLVHNILWRCLLFGEWTGTGCAIRMVMKIAIPIWNGRISPVFDAAKHLLVVEIDGGLEVARHDESIDGTDLARRADRVVHVGVDVLICGAISKPLEMMLASGGVDVIAHTCGPVEDVLQAFLTGQFTAQSFLMPGCCGQRRRFRRGRSGDGAMPAPGGGRQQRMRPGRGPGGCRRRP